MTESNVDQPEISIIIPTLNEEKLITSTLSQFTKKLKEKYRIELIISDGCSKDSTLEKAGVFADKLIVHKELKRQNIAMGRNRGACNSLGNVLIFLNADTFINDPDSFFDKALEILKNDSIAAIACNVSVFPEEEKISDYLFHKFYNSYCFILNKFFIGMGRGECHIVKRDLFFKIKGYDESLSAGEDFDLYKRLRKLGKIHFNFNLKVFESPRRYRKYGYFRVVGDWLKNSIWVMLFKKSSSESWEPVR